jgi:hypothetical protein
MYKKKIPKIIPSHLREEKHVAESRAMWYQ